MTDLTSSSDEALTTALEEARRLLQTARADIERLKQEREETFRAWSPEERERRLERLVYDAFEHGDDAEDGEPETITISREEYERLTAEAHVAERCRRSMDALIEASDRLDALVEAIARKGATDAPPPPNPADRTR